MKKTGQVFHKALFFSILLSIFSGGSVYAMSSKKKAEQAAKAAAQASKKKKPEVIVLEVPEENLEDNSSDSGTMIAIPRKKNTYFAKIDENIVSGIENGSPESIKQALSAIRKSESEYTENEKVLIKIGCEIMNILWPSEKFSFDVPSSIETTPYTGALDFVRKGLFDSSTGNIDYLSSILPVLVVADENVDSSNFPLCEEALAKARTYRQESFLLDYLTGLLFVRKGEWNNAEPVFEKLYQNNPDVFEIIDFYSKTEYVLHHYDKASELSKKLLDSKTTDIEVLKLNAKIAFDMKDYDQAEVYVGRVLQQMPNNLEFLLFRARILVEKNDYIHAVSLLDMYSRQNSTNADYLLLRARVQLDWSKNINLATETIEKALTLYPDNHSVLLQAARIASLTDAPVAGKYADELVSEVLKADPGNVDAQIYSLNALEKRSLWADAYEISRRLVNDGNSSSDIISKHVDICLHLGKNSEALRIATRAYEVNPSDESVIQAYIMAQVANGNKTQSLSLINSLMDSSSSKMKSFLYYRRSFLQSTESASLSDLRSSLIANPRNSDALFRLYEIYYGKADYKKAQYYLKQVVALHPNDSTFRKLNESLTKLIQ